MKIAISDDYNFYFNLQTGYFARWGRNYNDNPIFCPYGPEILDIEVSTICSNNCEFCYKANTKEGTNMTFEMFKNILDNMPPTVTQVAFGIGDLDSNPDLWKMMEYCRSMEIIPNTTINGCHMGNGYYDKLSRLCGAVAVSLYNKDECYDTVHELSLQGLKQVNIHVLLAEETFETCMQVLEDRKQDKRLKQMYATIFLWLKPKGKGNRYSQLTSIEKLRLLVRKALDAGEPFGFDSCGSLNFLEVVRGHQHEKKLLKMIDPCESTLFSYYINVEGRGFPCSFVEGEKGYQGVDLLTIRDFVEEVWFSKETERFRQELLLGEEGEKANCRTCPVYDLKCN